MDRITLNVSERELLGKKVKRLRADGKLPAHIFGKGLETEHVSVDLKSFLKTFKLAGETTLVDLALGQDKVRPVLIRGIQMDPVTGKPLHIDFYQVDLKVAVKVPVPIELIGEEPEKVHLGEAIVLQTLNEIEVMALPNDLIEKIEVHIESLKEIDDAITVSELDFDREKLTVFLPDEEVVVKLAPAVSAEMEKLLEEEAVEQAAQAAEAAEESAIPAEGEVVAGEQVEGVEAGIGASEAPAEGGEVSSATSAEAPTEEKK